MKKYLLYSIIAVVGLGISGCKSWMDINENPNDANENVMTESMLLSAQQYRILNNNVNSTNAWLLSHHLTKSGEVSGNYTFLNGQIMPQNLDDWWTNYYTGNKNLKAIYDKAVANENKAYQGVAELLMIVNFQRVVDIWGDAPYSQALDPKTYAQPAYDDDAAIYADLIARADNAIANLESVADSHTDGEFSRVDIMCYGDLHQWVRLAYTIKLRLLMRVSMVQDVSAQVTAIENKCLGFNENINANPGYLPETDKMNILYERYGWDKNGGRNNNHRYFSPTSQLVDLLKNTNDPRLRVYADPRRQLGNAGDEFSNYSKFGLENDYYIGIPYGSQNPSGEKWVSNTGMGLLVGGSDHNTGRVRASTFVAGSEVAFLLAEAALRGIIPGGDAKAKQYYEAGVASAMKRHENALKATGYTLPINPNMDAHMLPPISGTAEEAAADFLSQNNASVNWALMSSTDEKMNAICTQRWLAFVGYNPLEAWFEQRRTDLPHLTAAHWSDKNQNVCRCPYPQTERNLNMANIAEKDMDIFNSLVFWDKENPVVDRTELYL